MDTIMLSLSALASSALLNLGFVRLAERLDPLSWNTDSGFFSNLAAAIPCVDPGAALPCVDPGAALPCVDPGQVVHG